MTPHWRYTPDFSRPGGSGLWQAGLRGSGLVIATLLCALALAQSLYAADWTCGDVPCLINRIKEANGNGEANTLTLEVGHYILMAAEAGGNGLPLVTGRITITGAGAENTVLERAATAPPFRLVQVAPTGNLTVNGVTFRGGMTLGSGGGFLIEGELHLLDSDVADNIAGGDGGGLAVYGSVALWSTIVARNTAEGTGPDCFGSVISLGNNLIGDPTGCALTLRADDLTWAPDVGYGADLLSQPSGTGGPAVVSPRFAFASSKASGMIFGFTVDASGRLIPNGSVVACQGPVGLAADHTRQWLYVACSDKPFEVVVFRIATDGHLALQQKVPVSGAPSAVAVASSNCCLYVTKSRALPVEAGGSPGSTSFTLQRYMINQQSGLLTFAEEQRTQGADPDAVALTLQGDYAIVANTSENHLMTFRTNPISGQMTAVGLTPTGLYPTSLAVTLQGDLLIVGCKSKDGVFVYAIDHSKGSLTLVDRHGSYAAGLGVSPDGSSVIVTWWDNRTVTAYTIDHAAQKLVFRQTVVDTGGEPSTYNGSVGFNDGGSFYVVNIHDATLYKAGNVQRYTIDATGKVMAQEYVPAGLQPAALAIAK